MFMPRLRWLTLLPLGLTMLACGQVHRTPLPPSPSVNGLPDLAATYTSMTSSCSYDILYQTVTITNIGSADAGAFKFMLDAQEFALEGLKVGESATYPASGFISLYLVIDDENEIMELDEQNNRLSLFGGTSSMPCFDPTPTPTGFVGSFVIEGYVYDLNSGEPIPNARISYSLVEIVSGEQRRDTINAMVTDLTGYYWLGPVNQRDTSCLAISAEAEGYWSVETCLTGVEAQCLYENTSIYLVPTSQAQGGVAPCQEKP